MHTKKAVLYKQPARFCQMSGNVPSKTAAATALLLLLLFNSPVGCVQIHFKK
jgi:hypothetical protein